MTYFVHEWFLWHLLFIFFYVLGISLHILWPYVHVPLLTYSVHILPHVWHVPPLHDLVYTLEIFMAYFVHFLLVGEPIFTWIFYDYLCVPLVTYSLHIPLFGYICYFLMVYSVHIPPRRFIFYNYHLFMYTREFYGLFCIFASPWGAYLYMGDILWLSCERSWGDLFCTLTSCWWRIFYIRKILIDYCVNISPHFYLFSLSTKCSWHSLYTSDFHGLFCLFSSPWWANLSLDILWLLVYVHLVKCWKNCWMYLHVSGLFTVFLTEKWTVFPKRYFPPKRLFQIFFPFIQHHIFEL